MYDTNFHLTKIYRDVFTFNGQLEMNGNFLSRNTRHCVRKFTF